MQFINLKTKIISNHLFNIGSLIFVFFSNRVRSKNEVKLLTFFVKLATHAAAAKVENCEGLLGSVPSIYLSINVPNYSYFIKIIGIFVEVLRAFET